MALPPWTVELLRRGIGDVAGRVGSPEKIAQIRAQAEQWIQELPQATARGIDRLIHVTDSGSESLRAWTQRYVGVSVAAINASGTLLGDDLPVPAAPAAVIETAIGRLCDSRIDLRDRDADLQEQFAAAVGVSGDQVGAAVAASFPAAIAAIGLLHAGGPVVCLRRDAVPIAGRPLPDLLATMGGPVTEIGVVGPEVGRHRSDPPPLPQHGFWVRPDVGGPLPDGEPKPGEPKPAWPPAAEPGGVVRVDVLACGLPMAVENPASLPTIARSLAGGAGLVVLPCGGVIAGPATGLIVGDRRWVQAITSDPRWAVLAASVTDQQTTAAAMTQASQPTTVFQRQAGTSLDNLQDRATRLATRIAGSAEPTVAEVRRGDAAVIAHTRWKIPSRQVVVRSESITPAAMARRLRSKSPAILVDVIDDAIAIDLRWVEPADDGRIAEAFA